MSRPSFIGILLLTCGLLLMAGLVLWHHERLNQLDQQVMQLRLEKKLLRTGPVPIEPEAPMVQSLPEPPPLPPAPRQRQTVEPAEQGRKPLRTGPVTTELETPKIRSLPEPPPPPAPRQRQTVGPAEQGKKPLRTELVPAEPETPVIRSLPEPPPPLAPRQRQTVEPTEQDETLRRLANSAIDEECQRRGLSTDTLGETWRCVATPPEGKK